MTNTKGIIKQLHQLVDSDKLCGYNLAIIDGEQLTRECYGYSIKGEKPEKVQYNTKYDLASLSKVISTTTCILKLMDEGLLKLDDKVSDYIPIVAKDITVRQCLTHTTGFESDIAGYKALNDEQFMKTILSMEALPQYKGKVHYSDINFIYLGFIVKKLKGALDGYAHQAVFSPLQMNDTEYNPIVSDDCAATEVNATRGVIRGRVHDGKAYRLMGVSGSAGVFSTADDILKFVAALMDPNHPYFSENDRELLTHVLADTNSGRRCAGWIFSDPYTESVGTSYSECTLYHTGFTGGSVYMDLINHKAMILLCNRVYPTRNNDSVIKIRKDLHNMLYQEEQ